MAKYSVIDRKPFDFGVGMKLHPAEIHMVTTVDTMSGVGVTDLAEVFGVTKGAVSQQVAKLVKKGLLIKSKDPENGTRVVVTTTELGKIASDNHLEFHQNHDRNFLDFVARLDDASFAILGDVVDEMDSWMDSYLA